jgi:hypothetical protein
MDSADNPSVGANGRLAGPKPARIFNCRKPRRKLTKAFPHCVTGPAPERSRPACARLESR